MAESEPKPISNPVCCQHHVHANMDDVKQCNEQYKRQKDQEHELNMKTKSDEHEYKMARKGDHHEFKMKKQSDEQQMKQAEFVRDTYSKQGKLGTSQPALGYKQ